MIYFFLTLIVPGFLAVCIALGILSSNRKRVNDTHGDAHDAHDHH